MSDRKGQKPHDSTRCRIENKKETTNERSLIDTDNRLLLSEGKRVGGGQHGSKVQIHRGKEKLDFGGEHAVVYTDIKL